MKIFFYISVQIFFLCLFSATYSKEVKQDMLGQGRCYCHRMCVFLGLSLGFENLLMSISWANPPSETKSFAIIVDDPDAPDPANPKMTWVHWVLYNIPATTVALDEGITRLPSGTLEGLNDWKQTGYRGPCPPIGKHRYFFKLYALDTTLTDMKSPTKAKLEKAMEGYILSKAELLGVYKKK